MKKPTADGRQSTAPEADSPASGFVREEELRREEEAEPLAGCDVEHCQRMHE
jgi:hypothetical protein